MPEKIIYADTSDDPNIRKISELQQQELELLHSSPKHFINHEVLKIWDNIHDKLDVIELGMSTVARSSVIR